MVNGDKNTVKAQQGVDILAGAAVGHGNGFNGSGNGDNNHNNQQYVTGSGNTVIGTVYTSNNGVRRPCLRLPETLQGFLALARALFLADPS